MGTAVMPVPVGLAPHPLGLPPGMGQPGDADLAAALFDGTQEKPDGHVMDGIGRERASLGPSANHEIGSYSMPQDQASLPVHMWGLLPAHQTDTDPDNTPPSAQEGLASAQPGQDPELVKDAMAALYGSDFPLLKETPDDGDWVAWGDALWARFSPGKQQLLHLVERNRSFYGGAQWLSSAGLGPWREPPKPRDTVRVVDNMIQPALDMRTQLVQEQRPGFQCTPNSGDSDATKKAEALQNGLEYQWHQQRMQQISAECEHRCGTDGTTFIEGHWDPDAGPWYEVPQWVAPEQAQPGHRFPMGDVKCRVLKIEQVCVSPDATATRSPLIWVIREKIARLRAVREHGPVAGDQTDVSGTDDGMQHVAVTRNGYIMPGQDALLEDQETVTRITVYVDKCEFLPKGLMLVTVGRTLAVPPIPLPYGCVPIARWTDGSTDPSFFVLPVMCNWIDDQMRCNAIWSKWVEAIRKGANTNLLARSGTVAGETMIGGTLNVFEVKGGAPLDEVVKTFGPFDISGSALQALQAAQKRFEDRSGWSDTMRGSFASDQSGRAILAVREQVERIFAPCINAAAQAITDWATNIARPIMKAMYDLPRSIAVEGNSRPDLGRLLSSDDIDDATKVWVEPETLMPMPSSLRRAVLDDMLQKGLITPQNYMQRQPFGWVRNLDSPDQDQSARANRVAETIRQTGSDATMPVLWQDNEAIHQDVLERQLILNDDLPPQVRAVANERWMRLGAQAMSKQQGMQIPPGEPQPQGGAPGAPAPTEGGLPGQTTATGLQGPNRFLGAAHASGISGPTASTPLLRIGLPDQLQAAARFEQTAPQ